MICRYTKYSSKYANTYDTYRVSTSLCCRSAFFYFCQELRGKMRELHPEMGVGDIAKELGKLWMSTDLQTKSKYMAIAEEDRARYERVRLYRNMFDILEIILVCRFLLMRA